MICVFPPVPLFLRNLLPEHIWKKEEPQNILLTGLSGPAGWKTVRIHLKKTYRFVTKS